MPRIPRPQLNKIPGDYMPVAEKEVHTKDLTTLSHLELKDLKVRQEKLLVNKKQLLILPDKGQRIKQLYDSILSELERRTNIDEAAKLFSNLNIASTGQKILNNLEWNGNLCNKDDTLEIVDSDDDDVDILRILAQERTHRQQVKIIKPEPNLITDDDIKEIESFKLDKCNLDDTQVVDESTTSPVNAEIISMQLKKKLNLNGTKLNTENIGKDDSTTHERSSSNVDPHVNYVIEKSELNATVMKEKFKPYQTTISNVHDPVKERMRKKPNNWEVTAATPPPIQHNPTQMLSLMESVEIQEQYLKKLKELQEKQATERLLTKQQRMEKFKIKLPDAKTLQTQSSFISYRSNSINVDDVNKLNENKDKNQDNDSDDEQFKSIRLFYD